MNTKGTIDVILKNRQQYTMCGPCVVKTCGIRPFLYKRKQYGGNNQHGEITGFFYGFQD